MLRSLPEGINRPDQRYSEWIVIVWFHIALHYVDAVLADKKGWNQIEGHRDTRIAPRPRRPATREPASPRPTWPPYGPSTTRSARRCAERFVSRP